LCDDLGFDGYKVAARYKRVGDDFEELFKPFRMPNKEIGIEVKKFIIENQHLPLTQLTKVLKSQFNQDISIRYITQYRSDVKNGRKPSPVREQL